MSPTPSSHLLSSTLEITLQKNLEIMDVMKDAKDVVENLAGSLEKDVKEIISLRRDLSDKSAKMDNVHRPTHRLANTKVTFCSFSANKTQIVVMASNAIKDRSSL